MAKLKIEYKKTDDLIPYVNNSRVHTTTQINQVAASIQEFGFVNPVIIDDEDGIVAGHCRVLSARKLDMEEVPCINVGHLTPLQLRAYIIADNKLAENSEFDNEVLSLEIQALMEDDYNISLLGFDAEELNLILEGDDGIEGLVDEDEAPEPPENPASILGDVWILGEHRLMCGDSTSIDAVEKLMNGEKADMVFTDPPYGYKYESNRQSEHKMLENDDKFLDFLPAIHGAIEDNSALYICGSFQTISTWIDYIKTFYQYKNLIVWKKNNWSMGDLKGAFAGQHELIIFAHKGRVEIKGKRDPDVWSFDKQPPDVHPTQKPVELVSYAMSKVSGVSVLDPFLGSGSTLIAAEQTGRKCYGMELDEKYCDVIIERWQDFTGKKAVHAETGKNFKELKDGE